MVAGLQEQDNPRQPVFRPADSIEMLHPYLPQEASIRGPSKCNNGDLSDRL